MTKTAALESGIYDNIPFDEYLAIDAMSMSRLKDIGRSPAYCKLRIETPSSSSAAMAVGSLADCLLFEPELEAKRFAKKDYDGRTKEGKARKAEIDALGATVISADDYDRTRNIVAAVKAHPFWGELEDVRTQVTGYVHANPGTKIRPDLLATRFGKSVLVDLKVCRQAAQNVYPRAYWNLWHPHQLYLYRDVLETLGHKVDTCYILAVHPEPPHEVTAYQMTPLALEEAGKAVEARAELYADCVRSGVWGVGEPVLTVDPPEWAMPDELLFDEGE